MPRRPGDPANELGIRSTRLEGKFTGEGWRWSTMDYYLGRQPDLYDRVMKKRLARSTCRCHGVPNKISAHHRWLLGRRPPP